MPQQEPTGVAVFCDDIRTEEGGKFSLIGIHTDDLKATQFPFFMPKLAILVIYSYIPGAQHVPDVTLDIYMPGETRDKDEPSYSYNVTLGAVRMPGDYQPTQHNVIGQSYIRVILSPLFISEPGRIAVHLKTEGHDNIRCGRFVILPPDAA